MSINRLVYFVRRRLLHTAFGAVLFCSLPAFAQNESAAKPKTCAVELGKDAAKKLVDQCIAVSQATHPPCNVENPCAMIRTEIRRACALIPKTDSKRPAFCVE